MVIWIDGTYGIGKTAVSMKIKEQFPDCAMEILESDIYAEETLKEVVEEAKEHNSNEVYRIFPHGTIY